MLHAVGRGSRVNAPKFAALQGAGKITVNAQNQWHVPSYVTVPYIEGEGIGPEVMTQTRRVVDSAVRLAYGLMKGINWKPLLAGVKAQEAGKDLIPQDTADAINEHHILLKGPMGTPLGGGHRSLNVTLRNMYNLYACIRPVKTMAGVPTPLKDDKKLDVVIFRENTEDLYKGFEFEPGSPGMKELQAVLKKYSMDVPDDAALGIKPISESASKRIVAKAIQYALDNDRPSVTVMHKANIMKFTEGGFLKWAKEVAQQQFPNKVLLWDDFQKQYGGDFKKLPKGPDGKYQKIVLQDCIADNMFQQMTLNPQNHSVIVTMNLNGDYISDDAAANVGGLGLAPGANIGDKHAIFEATHGTAPDIAGQNKANPTALFLTTVMMLNHMGWTEAADILLKGVETAMANQQFTGDLASKVPGAKALGTKEYTDAVIEAMKKNTNPQRKNFVA